MSNEHKRPTAQDDHPPAAEQVLAGSQDVLDSQPRQVARVNMPLDEAYDDPLDDVDQPVIGADRSATDRRSVGGGWGPTAWLLGLGALAVSIGVLIFIMQGVFQSMPT